MDSSYQKLREWLDSTKAEREFLESLADPNHSTPMLSTARQEMVKATYDKTREETERLRQEIASSFATVPTKTDLEAKAADIARLTDELNRLNASSEDASQIRSHREVCDKMLGQLNHRIDSLQRQLTLLESEPTLELPTLDQPKDLADLERFEELVNEG